MAQDRFINAIDFYKMVSTTRKRISTDFEMGYNACLDVVVEVLISMAIDVPQMESPKVGEHVISIPRDAVMSLLSEATCKQLPRIREAQRQEVEVCLHTSATATVHMKDFTARLHIGGYIAHLNPSHTNGWLGRNGYM